LVKEKIKTRYIAEEQQNLLSTSVLVMLAGTIAGCQKNSTEVAPMLQTRMKRHWLQVSTVIGLRKNLEGKYSRKEICY